MWCGGATDGTFRREQAACRERAATRPRRLVGFCLVPKRQVMDDKGRGKVKWDIFPVQSKINHQDAMNSAWPVQPLVDLLLARISLL